MEKIIKKLYDLHLQEEQYPFGVVDKENMRKEYEAYCTLAQTLAPLMKEKLSEYVNLNNERHKTELMAVYEFGFKTAMKLVLECVKE